MVDGNITGPPHRRGDDETRAASASLAIPAHRGGPGAALSVALLLTFVLALYWRTTLSMASIWERSETFTHGYVVIPIFLYLIWRQRHVLAAIEPVPCYAALGGIAAAGAIWLVGELVSAASISQFAMIAMIPFAVWGVLGTRVVKALAIPLGFLFFAVPFGEFLVPTLMDWTADFAISAISASGVPVYREGNYFMIPSGRWSIVEACSGLRYLIASFMVGSLYAYLSYRSSVRRVVFIVASLIVPIVANWLRAYMIVMLGHLTNNRIAVGVDHLIYGWIFFGVVMMLLFWIGSRWREDEDRLPVSVAPTAASSIDAQPIRRIWTAVLAAAALIAIWLPIESWVERVETVGAAQLTQLAGNGGWNATPDEVSAWRPDVSRARTELRQSFAKDGARVGLYVAFFRNQTRDAKAITSNNQLVATSNTRWKQVGDGTISIDVDGRPFRPRTAVVTDGRERLTVWQWFWVDGRITSSEFAAKFYQVLSVVQGHGDPVAWVVVYTPTEQGGQAQARATLQAFTADMRGTIDAALWQAAAE